MGSLFWKKKISIFRTGEGNKIYIYIFLENNNFCSKKKHIPGATCRDPETKRLGLQVNKDPLRFTLLPRLVTSSILNELEGQVWLSWDLACHESTAWASKIPELTTGWRNYTE